MTSRRARCASLALVFVCAAGLAPQSRADASFTPEALLVRVTIADAAVDIPKLARQNLDIAGVDPKRGFVDVVGSRGTYDLLRAMGFTVAIDRALPAAGDAVAALTDYREPSEINQTIDDLVAAHPALAKKVQYATTSEGRPVYALKISDNVNAEEDEPAIFFVAQHHAREVMTPEIALDIADWLLGGYGSDPRATAWVDADEIFVLPSHNPDGTYLVFHGDANWRKNRRVNGDGSFGVDPNRNYPFKWGGCSGSSGFPSDETYRGPSPGSEPETTSGANGITEIARQQRPVISLSYHTYSELVIMPYGCQGSHTSENQTFRRFASDLSSKLVTDDGQFRYVAGAAWEILYAVDGASDDWLYGELGTYAMTVEANSSSQGFQPNYATWRDSTVQRNRPGWQYLLDRLDHGPSVRGHVTDACTGAPLSATVSLDEVAFVNGETPRTSEPGFGRYQWLTSPGTVTVRAAKAGYSTQAWPVSVGTAPADRDVALVPTGSSGLAVATTIVTDASADNDGQADPGEQDGLTIRLVNVGGATVSSVTATLATADPYVTIVDGTASYGSIAPNATADGDGFTVQIAPEAPDEHVAVLTLALGAGSPLCAAAPSVSLRITKGTPSCPFAGDTLDVDPGWTIQNAGSGGWAFGAPLGNGGSTGPSAAFSGTNVYGTNLSGNYGDNGDFVLTTGPYDLRGLRHAELRTMRWLDNEAGYDLASTEISTDGGSTWGPVWSGFAYGEGWQPERFDIAASADQESDVRFRFRLKSDTATTRPGFYLDDLAVCGEAVNTAAGKLKYESSSIDDSGADYGNGNGAVDAGETARLAVTLRSNRDTTSTAVEAFLSTTTPGVTIRNGYAAFQDVAAGSAGSSLAPDFTFTADGTTCGRTIAFALDIRWAGGGASTSTFGVRVGTPRTTTLLTDDFETDTGWVAGSLAATAGYFVREDPYAVTDAQAVPVQPDNDTTADPGALCWITANPRPKGNFTPPAGDVDAGTVWIQSPAFDGTGADSLALSFNRWFVRRNASQFDSSQGRMRVSRDNGATWVTVKTYEADAPQWIHETMDLVPFTQPSAQMKVRFEVQEQLSTAGDTLLEGLLDDVTIDRVRTECDPFNPPVRSAPHAVGATITASKVATHERLDWSAPPVDGTHDAATSYRVYRSASPSGGFAVALAPTSSFAVLEDALVDPVFAYLLVVAENGGGTSGDVPAP